MAKEIASILLRNSLATPHADPPRCTRCRRSPLVGELLHVLRSGKRVCSLCVARSASREGDPVSTELVRSSGRRLTVVHQRAA